MKEVERVGEQEKRKEERIERKEKEGRKEKRMCRQGRTLLEPTGSLASHIVQW
jgi:hypothetical protein